MRYLITGGHGQLASDLCVVLAGREVEAPGRAELDITDPEAIGSVMDRLRPDVVINTAAFHKVDLCEDEPEQSLLVNAGAPQRLAHACREHGSMLVHLSTDYVFDGERAQPYSEDFPVHPLSVYGASKAAGEMMVRATTPRHTIVRTTGLYGHAGARTGHGNFVETMLRLARDSKSISVVSDQVLTPSYTRDVAEAIVALLDREAFGTFHVTNSGQCSWYEFALEIFRLAEVDADVRSVTQAERPAPARRPAYSVLAHDGLSRLGLPGPRDWREALAAYMEGKSLASGTA